MGFAQEDLSLDQCRARVIEYNPTLKSQDKQVESAESNIKSHKKDYLPSVDVGGDYTFLQKPVTIETGGESIEGPQNVYSVNAAIVQNVYSGSSVRKANEMASLQKDHALSTRDNVEDFVLLETELAFWGAVYNKRLLHLSDEYKKAIDDLAVVIKDKVDNQIISRNDLILIEVRQNEAELYTLTKTNQLEISVMELNRIIGYPLDQKHNLLGELDEITVNKANYSLNTALESRPDIAAKMKEVDMQKVNADLVKAKYLPSVYVGVAPTWGAPNTNIGATNPNYNTAVMAGVKIPITRWGKKRQDVGKEIRLAEAASFQLQEMQDVAKLEINSSGYQLEESVTRVELTTASLAKSTDNLSIMTDRYLEGLTSILEVLDAQLYWQKSYKDMLDAQLYYKRAYAYYKNSIGEM